MEKQTVSVTIRWTEHKTTKIQFTNIEEYKTIWKQTSFRDMKQWWNNKVKVHREVRGHTRDTAGTLSGWTVGHVYPPDRSQRGAFGKGSWERFDQVCVLNVWWNSNSPNEDDISLDVWAQQKVCELTVLLICILLITDRLLWQQAAQLDESQQDESQLDESQLDESQLG